jgi:hypothetical protein
MSARVVEPITIGDPAIKPRRAAWEMDAFAIGLKAPLSAIFTAVPVKV